MVVVVLLLVLVVVFSPYMVWLDSMVINNIRTLRSPLVVGRLALHH